MNPEPKPTHGGARAGAGRKVLYNEKMLKITISLPHAHVDALCTLGDGNVSLGVRRLLENYLPSFKQRSVRNLQI